MRLVGKLAKSLAKLFLKVIIELILSTEENNTTLRDCKISSESLPCCRCRVSITSPALSNEMNAKDELRSKEKD